MSNDFLLSTKDDISNINFTVSRISKGGKAIIILWSAFVIWQSPYFYNRYISTQLPTFLMSLYSIIFAGLLVSFSVIVIPLFNSKRASSPLDRRYLVSSYYGAMFMLGLIIINFFSFLLPISLLKEGVIIFQLCFTSVSFSFMTLTLQDMREFVLSK